MPADPTVISQRELCAATGVSPSRIEFLIRIGVVVPATTGQGKGVHRDYTVENILEVSLADELMKAGFSRPQLHKVATTLRATIANLSPAERIVARLRFYVVTVQRLAEIFGRADGYDAWLKLQTQQLRRMERTIARAGDAAGLDIQLRDLFVVAKPANGEPSTLVG